MSVQGRGDGQPEMGEDGWGLWGTAGDGVSDVS